MPLVKTLWDNDMRLKLFVTAVRQMNFTPSKWDNICQQLGPAYSKHHCKYGCDGPHVLWELICIRVEWKRIVEDNAAEPSTRTLAATSDNSPAPNSHQAETPVFDQQPDDSPSNVQHKATGAQDPHVGQNTTELPPHAEAMTPTKKPEKRKKGKKAAANTSKNRRPREDGNQPDGHEEKVTITSHKKTKAYEQ